MGKSEEIKIYTGVKDIDGKPLYVGDLLVNAVEDTLDDIYKVIVYKDEFCIQSQSKGWIRIINDKLNTTIETHLMKIKSIKSYDTVKKKYLENKNICLPVKDFRGRPIHVGDYLISRRFGTRIKIYYNDKKCKFLFRALSIQRNYEFGKDTISMEDLEKDFEVFQPLWLIHENNE